MMGASDSVTACLLCSSPVSILTASFPKSMGARLSSADGGFAGHGYVQASIIFNSWAATSHKVRQWCKCNTSVSCTLALRALRHRQGLCLVQLYLVTRQLCVRLQLTLAQQRARSQRIRSIECVSLHCFALVPSGSRVIDISSNASDPLLWTYAFMDNASKL